MDNENNVPVAPVVTPNNGQEPGRGKAIAGLILGIVALTTGWFGLGLVAGIIGIVLAAGAKKEGFVGGLQTAAFVLSLIGTILGGILFFAICLPAMCIACAATASMW